MRTLSLLTSLSTLLAAASCLPCPLGAHQEGAAPPDGKKLECVKKDGTKHGAFTTWRSEDVIHKKGYYEDGKMHGVWRKYHSSGALFTEAHYERGEQHGTWLHLDRDGQVMQKGEFVRGKRCGTWLEREDDHIVHAHYHDSVLDGPYRKTALDETPLEQGAYAGGERTGTWTLYDGSGARLREGAFLAGKEHGTWTSYHPEGQRRSIEGLAGGERHGPWALFDEQGVQLEEGSYEQGKLTGSWRRWDEQGRETEQGQYAQGKMVGEWSWWADGPQGARIQRRGSYRDGVLRGDFSYADEQGRPADSSAFSGMAYSGEITLVTAEGEPIETGQLVAGRREGIWTHAAGTVSFSWRDGERHGPFSLKDAEGEVLLEGSFQEGLLQSLQTDRVTPMSWLPSKAVFPEPLAQPPLVRGKYVYAITIAQKLHAIRMVSGKEPTLAWSADLGAPALGSPRYEGGNCPVRVQLAGGELRSYAVQEGNLCQTLPISSQLPVVSLGEGDERLYVGASGSRVTAWRASDGEEIWNFEGTAEVKPPLLPSRKGVVFADASNTVYELARDDGAQRSSKSFEGEILALAYERERGGLYVRERDRQFVTIKSHRVQRLTCVGGCKGQFAVAAKHGAVVTPWRVSPLVSQQGKWELDDHQLSGAGSIAAAMITPAERDLKYGERIVWTTAGRNPEIFAASVSSGSIQWHFRLPPELTCDGQDYLEPMPWNDKGGGVVLGCLGSDTVSYFSTAALEKRKLDQDGRSLWRSARKPGQIRWCEATQGTVLVTTDEGIQAYDDATGALRWQTEAEHWGLDNNGQLRWRVVPVVSGAVVAHPDGARFVGRSIYDGAELWSYERALGDALPQVQPQADGGTVFVAYPDALVALDAQSGGLRWLKELPIAAEFGEVWWDPISRDGGREALAVADGLVFIATAHELLGFSASSGQRLHQREATAGSPLALHDDVLHYLREQQVFTLYLPDRDLLWHESPHYDEGLMAFSRRMRISGRLLYVGYIMETYNDSGPALHVWERRSGASGGDLSHFGRDRGALCGDILRTFDLYRDRLRASAPYADGCADLSTMGSQPIPECERR